MNQTSLKIDVPLGPGGSSGTLSAASLSFHRSASCTTSTRAGITRSTTKCNVTLNRNSLPKRFTGKMKRAYDTNPPPSSR